jgi:hypothetical protein
MPYPFYQGYPNYNPMYYQQQLQNMQQMNNSQQNIQSSAQIQNGGFVMVKDINEAMNYPVAPGNSVTFKNENLPYIYTKTLGFSQLDNPIFEKFRLVKEVDEQIEEVVDTTENNVPFVEYVTKEEADNLRTEIDNLRTEINVLKEEINFLKEYIEDSKEVVSA